MVAAAEEEEEEAGEYEIECICDHRDNGGVQQFRVRWRGYSSGDDTWQALDTIEHTEAFEKYLPSMAEDGLEEHEVEGAQRAVSFLLL